jgi:adenylate cyclase
MSSEITALKEKINATDGITSDKVDAMNQWALLEIGNDPALAFDISQRAQNEASQINYPQGEAKALMHLGMCIAKQHRYADAGNFYQDALHIREKLNDQEGIAEVLSKMGNAFLFDGKYGEALAHYGRAIEIRIRLKDELRAADLFTNSGIIYGFQGNYSLALKSHMQALKTYEQFDKQALIATASGNIGTIYKEQQNYEEALKMFRRALEIREESKDLKAISEMLNNIGNVHLDLRNFEEALKFHQRALKLKEEIGDKEKIAFSYCNIGDVYRAMKQHERSLDFNMRSLVLFTELNEKRGMVQAYINLGESYFGLKNYAEAHTHFEKGIKLAEEMGLKSQLRKAYEFISEVFAHEENYKEAYFFYLKYTQLDKEILNAETNRQMAQMTMRYEIEQKERDAEAERVKNIELQKAFSSLEAEKRRSEELLNNILPEEVSQELKQSGKTKARSYDMATVLFADIQGFTRASERLSAEEIVSGIDEYFEEFDKIVVRLGIEKIKTIGDAYLCVAGVPVVSTDHAERMVLGAIQFVEATTRLKEKRQAENKHAFDFRIGIHSGRLVAGVVGIKKFAYDIWGDTVNTASRMQQNSEPHKINISQATYELLDGRFKCLYRGEIEVKGKGKQKMYFVEENPDLS